MLIEFQQGIYRQQDTRPFLTLGNKGVDINVDDSPTIVTFLHGNSNYLFTEDNNISNAWVGPFPRKSTAWLYWDINLTTGKRTFGYTVVDPFENKGFGSALPVSPKRGQHFFLTTENKMKYYTGKSWRTVVRVFAGLIKDNAQLEIFKNGSQIGRNIQSYAGHIIFNEDNIPVKKSGKFSSSEFVTTETEFKFQNDLGNTYKIENTQINARAIEPVPKYHCVNFKGPKKYGLASRLDPDKPCVGVAVEDFVKDRIGKIVTHGVLQNPDFWNFSEPYGTTIWVGDTGEITTVVPQSVSMQNIGYVINPTTVFIDIRHVITMIRTDDDCVLPSPTPTATPTMTPSSTVTPTATVQPSVTATVTPSATVTPVATLTPTPTITPTMTITQTVTVTPTLTVTPTPTITPSSSPTIVSVGYHEWKMSEDIGSQLFDTGVGVTLVDVPEHSANISYRTILRDPRYSIQDFDGYSANMYQAIDAADAILEAPVSSQRADFTLSFWLNPFDTFKNNFEEYRSIIAPDVILFNSYNNSVDYPYNNDFIGTSANSVPPFKSTHVIMSVENMNPGGKPQFSPKVVDRGQGYTADDIVTVVGGSGTPAVYGVTSVDEFGGIVSLYNTGQTANAYYTENPPSPTQITGGTGSGATVDLRFDKLIRFYINGVLDNQYYNIRRSDPQITGITSITESGYDIYQGLISQVRFYEYAVTPVEALDLYQSYTVIEKTPIDLGQIKINANRGIFWSGDWLYTGPYETAAKYDMVVNPDSTKLYFLGSTTNAIHTALLPDPGELSSAVFPTGKIDGNRTVPWLTPKQIAYGYNFSSDGSKVYSFIESWGDTDIHEFDCSTNWDLQTALPSGTRVKGGAGSIPRDVVISKANEINIRDIRFNSDGTKAYTLDFGNPSVIQFSCPTPYDIKTWVFDGYGPGAPAPTAFNFEFSSDGSKYFVFSDSLVMEFSCPTPWDVLSSFFDADRYTPSEISDTLDLTGVRFSSDGSYFYVGDLWLDDIHQYFCPTPWDIKTANHFYRWEASAPVSTLRYFDFSDDGTKLYILDSGNDNIHQYALSTAWDLSSQSFISSFSISPVAPNALLFNIGDSGNKLYVSESGVTYQYDLLVAGDTTTAVYNGVTLIHGLEYIVKGLDFKSDGTKLYLTGRVISDLLEFTMSTPWDISTATYISESNVFITGAGIRFSSDGSVCYTISSSGVIQQYSLSVPWDITTAVNPAQILEINESEYNNLQEGFIRPDGLKFYLVTTSRVLEYVISTPFDLTTSTLNNVYYIKNQTANAVSIFFKPDGTKFYILGSSEDTIFQYSCSVAWDISTSTYDSVSYYVGAVESSPYDTYFSPDGLNMYITGLNVDSIQWYTLGTAWDVSSAVYTTFSLPINTSAYSIFFKPDGTKVYALNSTSKRVEQFSLGTPWNISTAVDDLINIPLPSDYTYIGMTFDPNGDHIYGFTTDRVVGLDMSVTWDITSATHVQSYYKAQTVTSQTSGYSGMYFKPDGTKYYLHNSTSDRVYEINMSVPWDITTTVTPYVSFKLISAQDGSSTDVFLSDDGATMYLLGGTNDTVYQYTLSTPWLVSSATYASKSYSFLSTDAAPVSIYVTPDQSTMFVLGLVNDAIIEFNMSISGDVTTLTPSGKSYKHLNEMSVSSGVTFSTSGDKAYIIGTSGYGTIQYTLSTPWDVLTASAGNVYYDLSQFETEPVGLAFKPDGGKWFIIGQDLNSVTSFTMSSPWDITTSTTVAKQFLLQGAITTGAGGRFKPDGSKFYIVDSTSDNFKQFSLLTAWDIMTASYDNIFSSPMPSALSGISSIVPDGSKLFAKTSSNQLIEYTFDVNWDITTISENDSLFVISEDSTARGFVFSIDGTKLYVVGQQNDSIYQYTLSTPWDVGSAVYDSIAFSVTTEDATPVGIHIKPDGTKLYMLGNTNKLVHQYTMGIPWDLSTISYDSITYNVNASGEYGTTVYGITFSSDGSKLYIMRGITLYHYSLSIPWDITSAAPDVENAFSTIGYNISTPWCYAFNHSGNRLYVGGSAARDLLQFNLESPWDTSAPNALSTYNWDASFCVSVDGTAAMGAVEGPASQFNGLIVYKKSLGVWSKYSFIQQNVNVGQGKISNNGTYVFIIDASTISIYEDQLDGSYLLVDSIVVTNGNNNLSISNDGSVLSAGNAVYRKSGSSWAFEQTIADYNSYYTSPSFDSSADYIVHLTGDGNRLICSKQDYYVATTYKGQERQVWKYNTNLSEWQFEGIISLEGLANLTDILYFDGYQFTGTATLGSADLLYEPTNAIAASEDGSIIVMNYDAWDSQRTPGFTTISGAVVFKETTPGNWEFLQKLRVALPMTNQYPGFVEGDVGHKVAISSNGNRIAIAHMDSDYTQGGGHGQIHIYDWNETEQKYIFVHYIEPLVSWYGDSFGETMYFNSDGRYLYVSGQTALEDGQKFTSYQWFTSTDSDNGSLYEYDIGPVGSLPGYEFNSEFYKNWDTDVDLAYFQKPKFWPENKRYFANNNYPAIVQYRRVASSLVGTNTGYSRSVLAYNTGKKYAEFFVRANTFDNNTNLVINGEFDTDTDWTKGSGWSIFGGVANCSGVQAGNSDLYQNISAVTGSVYKVTFTISNYSGGTLTPVIGTRLGGTYSANGTYSELIVANGTNLILRADLDFIGDVDNVTVSVGIGARIGLVAQSYDWLQYWPTTVYLGSEPEHYTYDTRGFFVTNNNYTPTSDVKYEGVIGVAVDYDTNNVWFSLNGVWLNGGDPVLGTNPVFTMLEPTSEHKYLTVGVLQGNGLGVDTTAVTFNVSTDEFLYSIPTGYDPWEPLVQTEEYGYPTVVKWNNPSNYWRFQSEISDVVSDTIGTNNLTLYGQTLNSKPIVTNDWGFEDAGALYSPFDDYFEGYAELDTEIIKEQNEPWTISCLVHPIKPEGEGNTYYGGLFASTPDNINGWEFIVALWGDGTGETVDLDLWSYDGNLGGISNTATIKLRYNHWSHVALMGTGDGTMWAFVDGIEAGNFPFDGTAKFGLKYIGSDTYADVASAVIAEVAFFDHALDIITGTYTGSGQPEVKSVYAQMLELACGAIKNWTPNFFSGPPLAYGGVTDSYVLTTLMKTPVIRPTITIISDYDTITLTEYTSVIDPLLIISEHDTLSIQEYDSFVGPNSVLDTFGPYTFSSSTVANANFFFYSPASSILSTTGSSRRWCWDSNDTPSTGVGPTSGQGGNPEGYVYTEAGSVLVNDVFRMQYKTAIDMSPYVYVDVEFYTNQRGTDNNATCHLEINEDNSGWVQVGPTFGGPSDPDKVLTSGVQIWSHRTISLYNYTGSAQFRWVVTMPSSFGTNFHNDYGLDTITITGYGLR